MRKESTEVCLLLHDRIQCGSAQTLKVINAHANLLILANGQQR